MLNFIFEYHKVGSAAPSHSSLEFTIQDTKVDEFFFAKLQQLKCIRDTVGNVVEDSKFKSVYEEYKQQIEAIIKSDYMKCQDVEGIHALHRFVSLNFWNENIPRNLK